MFGGWYFFTRKEVDLMIVTKHAKQRMKQRCGLKEKSSDRIAKIAYEKGLRHSDLTGNLKKWVDGLYFGIMLLIKFDSIRIRHTYFQVRS